MKPPAPETRIDLNLMNVLYTVLAEGSVTRAAQRLSMSQPAVSNALGRLRYIMKDELFIKVSGGFRPTERALEIWPDLQQAMEQIRAIALPLEFQASQTNLTFNVAITDTLVSRVASALAVRFVEEAPFAKLQFHLHSNPTSIDALQRGGLDCAVGMFPNVEADLQLEGVFSDRYVCVFRRGHGSLTTPLSLKAFIDAEHILVKQATRQLGIVDNWLSLKGYKRTVRLVVNRAEEAISIVRETDLVAAVPFSFAQSTLGAKTLEIADLPFEHEKILYKLAWHRRSYRDPARSWLRSLVRETIINTCVSE
ncbi:LysR family transcriptional regulator [Agrobacterium sp. LAD9]|uniref:LysR family transcriptional regulator n=1 Tax=Agrobacterium sp. LAD9 TaxID=2055153 RepID=UPI0018643578|nr:LysR family transcriptional regulator [Agrobacterium sp. LAD9]